MKKSYLNIHLTIVMIVIFMVLLSAGMSHAQTSRWISGYVTYWGLNMTGIPGGPGAANYGNQPYDKIDLDAMTNVIMFTAGLDAQGRLPVKNEWDGTHTWGSGLLERQRRPFNDHVHSYGKPIVLTIFGHGGGDSWTSMVASSTARATAIRMIVDSIIQQEHYDGVDFDIEPFAPADSANTRVFIRQLYDTLQKYHAWYNITKKPLITAATYNYPSFWAGLAPYMNQINVMSYVLFGTWCTKVWHDNPVFAGADGKDIAGNTLTSVQNKIQQYINASVPRNKIGMGIYFNGNIWKGGLLNDGSGNGVTAPLQVWQSSYPPTKRYTESRYFELRKDYIDTATTTIHYDNARKVPYIGINYPGNVNDTYITFEDTSTMRELIILLDTMNIGGAILWDVNGGWLEDDPDWFPESMYPGLVRDPLLKAVKRTAMNRSILAGDGSIYITPAKGWNLVSVPLHQWNNSATVVFPGKSGNMLSYNTATQGYDAAPALTNGIGYWVHYLQASTVIISGSVIGSLNITVSKPGWVLIGSKDTPVQVTSLVLSNGAGISGDALHYNVLSNSYQSTTVINPGEACWINVTKACTVTLP